MSSCFLHVRCGNLESLKSHTCIKYKNVFNRNKTFWLHFQVSLSADWQPLQSSDNVGKKIINSCWNNCLKIKLSQKAEEEPLLSQQASEWSLPHRFLLLTLCWMINAFAVLICLLYPSGDFKVNLNFFHSFSFCLFYVPFFLSLSLSPSPASSQFISLQHSPFCSFRMLGKKPKALLWLLDTVNGLCTQRNKKTNDKRSNGTLLK